MISSNQAQINEKLNHLNALAYEMEGTAINTNVELHAQGEQLERIKDKTKEINKVVDKADKTSKYMTSWWYRMKERVKRLVGLDKEKEEKEEKKEEKKESSPINTFKNNKIEEHKTQSYSEDPALREE